MLFRINVSIKKRKTHRWGEILCFIYVFVIMHLCMLQKMCNRAPWGPTFQWVAEFGVTPAENRITRYPLVTEPPLQLGGTLNQGWATSMIKRATILHHHHQRAMWLCTSTRRQLREATHFWICWIWFPVFSCILGMATTYKIFQIHNLCMVCWLNQHTFISCFPCSNSHMIG